VSSGLSAEVLVVGVKAWSRFKRRTDTRALLCGP
jgi:hypothetical protein